MKIYLSNEQKCYPGSKKVKRYRILMRSAFTGLLIGVSFNYPHTRHQGPVTPKDAII